MTNAEPINWGILSTARIGSTAFIPSARATPGARVHAVASRSQDSADAFARQHDIPVALGGYQALVEHPGIDAVYISLPNSLHAEWTLAAARAGKHVFCEKPLAVTAAEGRRMVAACREAGVLLFEAFVFMHHPQGRRLLQIIGSGEIGALRHIDAGMTFVVDDPANIRMIEALGGGSIYDGGVYPITFSRFIAGADPVSVLAHMRFDERAGVDVAVSLILEFPGGLTATLYCGFQGRGGAHARITGDRGRVVVPSPYHPGPESRFEVVPASGEEPHRGDPHGDPAVSARHRLLPAVHARRGDPRVHGRPRRGHPPGGGGGLRVRPHRPAGRSGLREGHSATTLTCRLRVPSSNRSTSSCVETVGGGPWGKKPFPKSPESGGGSPSAGGSTGRGMR